MHHEIYRNLIPWSCAYSIFALQNCRLFSPCDQGPGTAILPAALTRSSNDSTANVPLDPIYDHSTEPRTRSLEKTVPRLWTRWIGRGRMVTRANTTSIAGYLSRERDKRRGDIYPACAGCSEGPREDPDARLPHFRSSCFHPASIGGSL